MLTTTTDNAHSLGFVKDLKGDKVMWDLELMEPAERIVREVVALRAEDKVLVITDAAKLNIGKALCSVSRMLGAETVLALVPMTGEHGNEAIG